jgi:hypothetical protein
VVSVQGTWQREEFIYIYMYIYICICSNAVNLVVLVVCNAESTVRCFISILVLLFLLYISDPGRRKVRCLPVLVLAIPTVRTDKIMSTREGGREGSRECLEV